MTHTFQTSVCKSRQGIASTSYQVEIEDFDNEYFTFDILARSFADANDKATSLAAAQCIDIYNMNIYKI